MNSRSFILSALISGVIIGILANLPVLNVINCFLCVFVWIGGIAAVFIYRAMQHGTLGLTIGQGAGLGALAGLFGAFVGIFVNLLTGFISQPLFNSIANYLQIGDLPFRSNSLPSMILSSFFFFIIDAIAYPLFGALSGLITVSLMGGGKPANTGEVS
jgi:hypothetical protein